jgi:tellurium resistance protein TerD
MTKGSKLKMQKADGSAINHMILQLGWTPQQFGTGSDYDLDASIVALVDNGDPAYPFGKGYSEDFVLYYNSQTRTEDGKTTFVDTNVPKRGKPTTPGCALIHSGDDTTGGSGTGDKEPDETIEIHFDRLPAEVNVLHCIVTIHDAVNRKQNFGQVRNSFARMVNGATNEVLANYDLEDDAPDATALLFVEIRKKNGVWTVSAVNQGFQKGLDEFFKLYGFQTA